MPQSLDINNCNKNVNYSSVAIVQLMFFGSILCVGHYLAPRGAAITPPGARAEWEGACGFHIGIPETLPANANLLLHASEKFHPNTVLTIKVPHMDRENPSL